MPLTPEEEKRFREELRKKLEEQERREEDFRKRHEEEKRTLIEECLRAKIKEEEEEKFYTERGYVKYINRHGEVEWLPPEEAEKRRNRRRSSRSSGSRAKRRRINFFINLAIVVVVVMTVLLVYKFNPGQKPKMGSLAVQTNISGAMIYLDGEPVNAFTPDTLTKLPVGRHLISVYREGFSVNPPVLPVNILNDQLSTATFELKSALVTGTLQIHVNLHDYRLYVDGLRFPVSADGRVEIPAGYHTVMVTRQGFLADPPYRRILVKSDEIQHVNFELVPNNEIGYLQISNNLFRGYIYLDNQFTGMQAQGDVLPIKAGTYEIRVRENGYTCIPDSQLINIIPGEKRLLIFRMEPVEQAFDLNLLTREPGTAVFIDGAWQPYVTPVRNLKISPGNHFINLVRENVQYAQLDRPIYVSHRSKNDYFFDF
ncbi:MAG: hypothetical protein Kow0042_14450 [Calditrichia bacterium]